MMTVTKEVSTWTSTEGMPTRRIVRTLSQSGFRVKENVISLFHLRLIRIPANSPINCPITVAIAAPLVPRPKVKMKMGSSIRLVIEAAESVNRNKWDLPLAITNRSNTHCPIWPRENSMQMLR